jgi:nitrite reductase/ring-hydroxylating ferredoxin subunit
MRLLLRSLPQHILSFNRRMSTQTIAVLAESELKNGQMKQVPFANGQVLLSRIDNQIHATSAYCTHYGAPLAKGVLSSGGRIVCPWHGGWPKFTLFLL